MSSLWVGIFFLGYITTELIRFSKCQKFVISVWAKRELENYKSWNRNQIKILIQKNQVWTRMKMFQKNNINLHRILPIRCQFAKRLDSYCVYTLKGSGNCEKEMLELYTWSVGLHFCKCRDTYQITSTVFMFLITSAATSEISQFNSTLHVGSRGVSRKLLKGESVFFFVNSPHDVFYLCILAFV